MKKGTTDFRVGVRENAGELDDFELSIRPTAGSDFSIKASVGDMHYDVFYKQSKVLFSGSSTYLKSLIQFMQKKKKLLDCFVLKIEAKKVLSDYAMLRVN